MKEASCLRQGVKNMPENIAYLPKQSYGLQDNYFVSGVFFADDTSQENGFTDRRGVQELINQSQSSQTYGLLHQNCQDQMQHTDAFASLDAGRKSVNSSWNFGDFHQPLLEPQHVQDSSKNSQALSSMPPVVNNMTLMSSAKPSPSVYSKREWIEADRPSTTTDTFIWHRQVATSGNVAQNHETMCYDIIPTIYQDYISQPSEYIPSETVWPTENMATSTGAPEVFIPYMTSPSVTDLCHHISTSSGHGPMPGDLELFPRTLPESSSTRSLGQSKRLRFLRPQNIVQAVKPSSLEKRTSLIRSYNRIESQAHHEDVAGKLPSPLMVKQQTQGKGVASSACLLSEIDRLDEISRGDGMENQRVTRRSAKDDFLVQKKQAGMTYKDIKREGGYTEAESTLRGRFRTLTKAKWARVRKPEWTDNDIRLLKQAVSDLTPQGGNKSKIPWKRVAEYILNNGGSYHFGNSTCRKRWGELQGTP